MTPWNYFCTVHTLAWCANIVIRCMASKQSSHMKTSTAFFVCCIEREKAKEKPEFFPWKQRQQKNIQLETGYCVGRTLYSSDFSAWQWNLFYRLELEIHQMVKGGPEYKRFELNHQIIIVGSLQSSSFFKMILTPLNCPWKNTFPKKA